MEYVSLIIHEDAAHDCITMLGDLGVVEFTDLNPELTPFQRRYASYIQRCNEMDRKLRCFMVEMTKFKISAKSADNVDSFLAGSPDVCHSSQDTTVRALNSIERILEDKEQELLQLNSMHEKLTREYNERKELQEIISRIGGLVETELSDAMRVSSRMGSSITTSVDSPMDASESDLAIRFKNITGVVPADERLNFERMVFRATRGNCFMRFSAIDELLADPGTGVAVEKHAFVIFFQSQFIETKLRKICDAFHARIDTIEFVLNMVSNTASYLRLWALSLAHSELSTVFFEKAMLSTINMDSFVAIFIGFAIFAGTTFGVILCMDVLECFLHALRLHWVEFQGKFYKADGIAFNPLRLKDLRSSMDS
ncbi:hypothetical protein SPRG_22235 [Saprolegnia parasitica CBS 223.65]|uniref:V-type proton ATPase subunit a n=1 Tax=Saprolegnia parasitica (strain CBS 223.65) TaxID=695850 RepID=A0A067C454_SAPPC|nr:hypothetical protein SPRG_22235 [Saprolegnia parasitica CBS 223.65]KDO25283.1 hypothetical protein SPRG_22235 [Saprolegnia parasitica CBS 223.65]|eukprot:XP_012204028.1 hypothetical protein SPRG_22235 [Saprolegnia parasitica CBS 223.65]